MTDCYWHDPERSHPELVISVDRAVKALEGGQLAHAYGILLGIQALIGRPLQPGEALHTGFPLIDLPSQSSSR